MRTGAKLLLIALVMAAALGPLLPSAGGGGHGIGPVPIFPGKH